MYYWTATFQSFNDHQYVVEIEDPSLTANKTFTLGADPVKINYEKGDTKYDPLKSASATISVVTSEDMSSIYSELWDRKLRVYDPEDADIFVGYVIPAQWSQPDNNGINQFTIEAQDGLARLKKIKYQMAGSSRSAITFQNLIDRCADILGLESDAEITYNDVDQLSDKFSEDVLLPEDHNTTEAEAGSSWKTYGDALEAVCLFCGATARINYGDGLLEIRQLDNCTSYWLGNATTPYAGTTYGDVTVEIEPAVSRVIGDPSASERCLFEDLVSDDRFKATSGYTKNLDSTFKKKIISKLCDSDSHLDIAGQPICLSAINDSDSGYPSSDDAQIALTGAWVLKDAAIHANSYPATVCIKASVFLQDTSYARYGYGPYTFKTSGMVSSTNRLLYYIGDDGTTKHYPVIHQSEYDADNTGYYNVWYYFVDVSVGKFQLGCEIPADASQCWIKSMSLSFPYSDDVEQVSIDITSDFDNELKVDLPLMLKVGQLDVNYTGAVWSSVNTDINGAIILPMLVKQYKKCRRRWNIEVRASAAVNVFKKVNFRGHICTIESAEIDVRNGRASVEILESHENDSDEE